MVIYSNKEVDSFLSPLWTIPADLTSREIFTPQTAGCLVDTTVLMRWPGRWPSAKESVQTEDGIGNVDGFIVIAVQCRQTRRILRLEQVAQAGDHVGEIKGSIGVGVSPNKGGYRSRQRAWNRRIVSNATAFVESVVVQGHLQADLIAGRDAADDA